MAAFAFLWAAFSACTQPAPHPGSAPAAAQAAASAGTALPVPTGTQPATTGEAGVASEAYVTQPTFVRRVPSEVKEVSIPGKKGHQANWLATLNRGEHVRVLELKDGWLRVQSSDETAGWIKQEGVLVGPEIFQATNLGPLRRFTRPDLLALVASKPIEAGSLLFVLRHKEAFSLVNYAGSATTWVLSDTLEQQPNEVEAAKLLHRARQLADRRDAAADGLFELARSRFAQTRIVAVFFPPPVPEPVAAQSAADENDLVPVEEAGAAAPVAVPEPAPFANGYEAWSAPNAGPPQTDLPPGTLNEVPAPEPAGAATATP